MDFAGLPPEVNSALIYTGPGPGSLLVASQTWDTLGTELARAGQATSALVADIAWTGPSATLMRVAISRYATWLLATATHATLTGALARNVALAYETARASSVPPSVVFANRAELAVLVATNILGQNSALIALNEAHYASMWAQDATAMSTYHARAGAALSALPAFTPAPHPGAPPLTASAGAPTYLATTEAIIESVVYLIEGGYYTLGFPVLMATLLTTLAGSSVVASDVDRALTANLSATGGNASVVVPDTRTATRVNDTVRVSVGDSRTVRGMSVPPSWAHGPPTGSGTSAPKRPEGARGERAVPVVAPFPLPAPGRSNQRRVRQDPEYGHVSKVAPPRHPSAG